MTLPGQLLKWLAAYGINLKEFEGFLVTIADKLKAPEEWKILATDWLREHGTLDEADLEAFANIIVKWFVEVPGYDPEHGGGA